MTVLAREPFLANPFRVFDQVVGRTLGSWGSTTAFVPTLDVRETEDEYLVMVDLPGVKSEDVSIQVEGRVLTITGSRTPVESGEAQLVERPYGAFSRMLTLPQGIDADSIRADYVGGVLTLRMPKPEAVKPKKIAIMGGAERKAIEK